MAVSICKIKKCVKKASARGWCSAHYARWRKHGDPLGGWSASDGKCRRGHALVKATDWRVYVRADGHRIRQCRLCWLATMRTHALQTVYSISEEQYDQLLEAQDGVCYICRKTDADRRLAVDHDHQCCPGRRSCGLCVRGLLCSKCNQKMTALDDWTQEELSRAQAHRSRRPIAIT